MSAPQKEWEKSIQLLAGINRLTLAAIQAKSVSSLIFLILNDTVSISKYNRALLWERNENKKTAFKLLGVSGQASVKTNTELSQKWQEIVRSLKEPEKIQIITHPMSSERVSILWMPIMSHDKLALGLWLERWDGAEWKKEDIEILSFLTKGYGAIWERFTNRFSIAKFTQKPVLISLCIIVICLMFLKVPLRIVAPCEVIAKKTVVITAPLEGIIEKIVVEPGETVKKGALLVEYDKRAPLQELRIAEKKVDIAQSEVNRDTSLAIKDKKALNELGIADLKLKKEMLELELIKFRTGQLEIRAPVAGVVSIENPEEWHGKPVHIGEKVMTVNNPGDTKIRLWIPDDDRVHIELGKPISIFLNIHPERSEEAVLYYISDYTMVTDKSVTSFVAEATWKNGQPADVQLGLKGTAILYGEKVSVFYWIARKPWGYVRRFIGI